MFLKLASLDCRTSEFLGFCPIFERPHVGSDQLSNLRSQEGQSGPLFCGRICELKRLSSSLTELLQLDLFIISLEPHVEPVQICQSRHHEVFPLNGTGLEAKILDQLNHILILKSFLFRWLRC